MQRSDGAQSCLLTGNQKTGTGIGTFRVLKLINKPPLVSSLQNPKPWESAWTSEAPRALLREADSVREEEDS